LQPAGRIAPGPHGRKENYPGSLPLAAVVFGVFFLIATWPLHSGRVTAGAVLTGLLWLDELFQGEWRLAVMGWLSGKSASRFQCAIGRYRRCRVGR